MITSEQLNQLLQLNLLLLAELADDEKISSDGRSLAKLRVAEHSFNFLLDSAVNITIDKHGDHELTELGGKDGNTKIRAERDKIANTIAEKIKALPHGEEDYKNYCDSLKNSLQKY